VLGPSLSSNDGSSSFGVVVDSAAGVRLDYVSIEAGNGAAGVTGDNKLPPIGTCVRGGMGGGGGYTTGQGTMWSSSCSAQPAAAGDSVYDVNSVIVAQGGGGGATGQTECSNPQAVSGDLGNGARGGNGQDGVQGAAGAAAPTDPGQFTYAQPGGDLVWIGNHGDRGGDGSHGAGGGGGAAGDNGDIYFWCMATQPVRGGAGHNGGNGGCGGGGGGGGSSGGGAFALVAADTSVGSAGMVLVGGTGGPGGGGGSSADGTLGVHDDNWGSGGEATNSKNCGPVAVPVRRAGTGGQGGYGGKGGGGGGGAGGNGGPAIQLVFLADGALTMDANAPLRYGGGRAGTGGTGGTGVQDKNAGPPGNGGSSAETMSIPLVYVAATASSNASGSLQAYAVDGNPETAWNSGGGPPAWIELDLKRTVTLAKVHLLVGQLPAGPTTQQLYFGPSPAPTALIATLSGSTKDMQWLDIDVPGQPTGRYLRVLTTASPSWVAWREIIVQTQ